jgi:hypothetical protein
VNAAHTERKEEQEILFKSAADATATEIRRVKRRKRDESGGEKIQTIWHFGYTPDHKVILKGKDAFSIYVP